MRRTGNTRECIELGPENLIFAPAWDGYVRCLDVENGDVVWTFKTDDQVRVTPTYDKQRDVLYVCSYDHHVYCLGARDGKLLWKIETEDQVTTSVSFSKRHVYFASTDACFYAYKLKKQKDLVPELVYKIKTGHQIRYGAPMVCKKRLYVGSSDGFLYCIERKTGSLFWKKRCSDSHLKSIAQRYAKKLYFGSYDGHFYCLHAKTGEVEWKKNLGSNVSSSPCVDEGRIYFGCWDNRIYAISEKGKELWNFETGDKVWSSPRILKDKLFVGSFDNKLYCLDKQSGEMIWCFETDFWVKSSPILSKNEDKVLFLSRDLHIYAVSVEDGDLVWKVATTGPIITR